VGRSNGRDGRATWTVYGWIESSRGWSETKSPFADRSNLYAKGLALLLCWSLVSVNTVRIVKSNVRLRCSAVFIFLYLSSPRSYACWPFILKNPKIKKVSRPEFWVNPIQQCLRPLRAPASFECRTQLEGL